MPLFRRARTDPLQLAREGVLWGVPRREAASDRDDPLVHAGLIQHAFPLGSDERAICGFQPPARTGPGGERVPQLALPGRDNPQCPRCVELLGEIEPTEPASTDTEESEPHAVFAESAEEEKLEAQVLMDEEAAADHDADSSPEVAETVDDRWQPRSAPDEVRTPRRSSVRRAGRITVPPGRRSIVTRLPAKLHGAAVTAEIEGSNDDLRVLSVRVADDGTVRITLNQRTSAAVDLVLYLVLGPQRQ